MYSALKRRNAVTAEERGEGAPGREDFEHTDHHCCVAVSLWQGFACLRCNMEPFLQACSHADGLTCVFPVSPYQHLVRSITLHARLADEDIEAQRCLFSSGRGMALSYSVPPLHSVPVHEAAAEHRLCSEPGYFLDACSRMSSDGWGLSLICIWAE